MASHTEMFWTPDNINLLVEKRIEKDAVFKSGSQKLAWLQISNALIKAGITENLNEFQVRRKWTEICEKYKKMKTEDFQTGNFQPKYLMNLHKFFSEMDRRKDLKTKEDELKKTNSIQYLTFCKYADRWPETRINLLIDHRIARHSLFGQRLNAGLGWKTVLDDLINLGEPPTLTIQQIKKKWDNLCSKFKAEKQLPESKWVHFNKMNRFYASLTDDKTCEMNDDFTVVNEKPTIQAVKLSYSDRWTPELTETLIKQRIANDNMFDGRGLSTSGWDAIQTKLRQEGLPNDITLNQIKKKWENIGTRYKILTQSSQKRQKSWIYYNIMHTFYSKRIKSPKLDESDVEESDHDELDENEYIIQYADDTPESETKPEQISKCRLCLEAKSVHPLTINKELCDKIEECTGIKVLEDIDCLPTGICNSCLTKIDSFSEFLKHCKSVDEELRLSITKEEFQCEICDDRFSTKTKLQTHFQNHFETNRLAVVEDNSEVNHQIHIQDVMNNGITIDIIEDQSLTCNVCAEPFKDSRLLKLHLRTHSNGVFVCPEEGCFKTYTSKQSYHCHQKKHLGLHHFLCMVCGKGFTTSNALKMHEKIHTNIKDHICSVCSEGFSFLSNLRAHYKKKHLGHRFYCSKCPKEFLTKSSMQRHEIVHTGIRDFRCDICRSAFYTAKELEKHQRYHNGTRKYHCNICFKTFYEKHHLVVHTRAHTGEKPYVCKVPGCGKAFRESNKLTRHNKTQHHVGEVTAVDSELDEEENT